ncbi:MAG: DUF4139 domain-containing protein [Desulfovibrio sp.]|nr:DUF4139 domain-containing protein [Desulfovibrio sp.]
MRQKFFVYLFIFVLLALFKAEAYATSLLRPSPNLAVISPQGGVLSGEVEVMVEGGEQSRVSLLLPPKASNVRLEVLGESIVSQKETKLLVPRQSLRAKQVAALKERLGQIKLRLVVLKERQDLWKIKPKTMTLAEYEAWDQKKESLLPKLLQEESLLRRDAEELEANLKNLPSEKVEASLWTITLSRKVQAKTLKVSYSYGLKLCGWKANYALAIDPEKEQDKIKVSLMAEVWQDSGFDWEGTELILVTGSEGKLAPPNLPPFILEAKEPARNQAYEDALLEGEAQGARLMARREKAPYVAPKLDSSGIYAKWLLPAKGLTEGKSQVLITEQVWQEKLSWVARPSKREGQVYLKAQHELKEGEVWPEGEAVFVVAGQITGKSHFAPKGGVLELYFGHDPRVSLQVLQDKRKRGESGFFGRKATWSWAFKYVVTNTHQKPVLVRLERPQAQIVQDEIKVTYFDKPKAFEDTNKHLHYWEVLVKGGGTETIEHALTIEAPENLRLTPRLPW